MKFIIAATLAVVAFVAFNANAMAGDENDKVFVCKYVGTPGVDEALQTGDNPISVSVAATGGAAVGSYFSDSQGRSFVLALDVGQDEPSVNDCPPPVGPPPTDVCTNIDGVQESVPEGMHAAEDENGRPICLPNETPVDVCPNLEGNQDEIPEGYGLIDGQCVPVDVNPLCSPPAVLVDGVCIVPPPPPVNPGVTGSPTVFCDLGAQLYRVRGTIDGQAVDSAAPPTIPGNTRGFTNVILTRGDTSFRTVVFTYGDCSTAPPVITTFTPPAVVTPVAPVVTPKPVVKPKPKPVRKPVAKKKPKPAPKKPIVHKCKPYKDGTKRVWVKGMGCHVVLPPEPENLTA